MRPLWTNEQTCTYLQIHPRTLARSRAAGTGPRYVKIGSKFMYRQEDVEEWLASRTFRHTAAEATGRHATP
ncbi:hypothetical protein AA13595_0898 [Gluconacetobacter johannae DSM 13595]|uniref:Helix-turn-helix domain-containing protein n=1 Tax=Gluconacetobacter johannae TaxID=112140 RepID=A0A7W4P4K9_9PROT|nr:helix-turn-helix domain-containing protein [Gluconacetobacter johannae]MBB2177014.1 helix-turn-helix domain-containing protein [Gluconacetobacter johannae]GBQ82337.1 hypothetical protein AA13595_0898 [Gluconacetobacter johannae DSM 13595]